jgi:tetratricopeptide (TPR) repeat protein
MNDCLTNWSGSVRKARAATKAITRFFRILTLGIGLGLVFVALGDSAEHAEGLNADKVLPPHTQDVTNTAGSAAVAESPTNLPSMTNALPQEPLPFTNLALRDSQSLFPGSKLLKEPPSEALIQQQKYQAMFDEAMKQKEAHNSAQAEKLFVRFLETDAPTEHQKTALLELAVIAHERQELAKSLQIYAQFLQQFPGDPAAPEVLLRQGLLYRQMGAPVMALSKFYAVMSTALKIKADQLTYYQHLVLLAQSEIADTYYLQCKYEEASDFFGRLLKLNSPELDRSQILFKLVRSLSFRRKYPELVPYAQSYLKQFPEADASPEVRFLLAEAFKKMNQNRDAMDQVLALLESRQKGAIQAPEAWLYWRQRTGNEIANELYQEGDYMDALQIYLSLATLNDSPAWQVPAFYQIGLVYERLHQPQKAAETYDRILQQQNNLGTNASNPSLVAVLDMAKWRKGYLNWQQQADATSRELNSMETTPASQ